MASGNWIKQSDYWTKGDLKCTIDKASSYFRDSIDSEHNDYKFLEIKIEHRSSKENLTKIAWNAFETGIRRVKERGRPKYIKTISNLTSYFPGHVELGCGPSIECGIPALNTLHQIYGIMKNGKFIFKPEDDPFYDFLKNTEKKYKEVFQIHKKTLAAEPSKFYFGLKRMIEKRKFISPIFTNNFDGIAASLDIEEHFLRNYDTDYDYPNYTFDKKAKSLFVIGAHADRRGVQKAARNEGLKIIFINPEGYNMDDTFYPYPLESPQSNDLIVQLPANEFMDLLLLTKIS